MVNLSLMYKFSLALVILMVLSTTCSAYSSYGDDVPGDLVGQCLVCHDTSEGGGSLNVYGIDYQANDYSVEAIASLDSDDDGYSNQEELEEVTLPGDAESYPEPEEPEDTPGFGVIGLAAGILAAMFIVRGRAR